MKHDYYYHRWNLFWFLVCYKLHKFTLLYNETSNRLFYMAYRYNSICITINVFINFYNVFIDFTAIALSSHHCQKLQKRDNFLTPPPLCTIKQWALLGQIDHVLGYLYLCISCYLPEFWQFWLSLRTSCFYDQELTLYPYKNGCSFEVYINID